MPVQPPLPILAGLIGLSLAATAAGTEPEHGFVERTHRSPDGEESRYVLFVPHAYQGDQPHPLIVSLHGDGERGSDGRKPSLRGLGAAVHAQERTFPFLVVFPQGHKAGWVADSEDGRRVTAILADVRQDYRVDPKRISITGMSSGGDGTWSFAARYPDLWAALVPVCGNGDPKDAPKVKDIPCWYFMGSADNRDWVKNAREMVQALREAGGHPTYTEYPGMGHGIWGKAYGTPELWDWLLKQRRD
jgi:predicted peptidase